MEEMDTFESSQTLSDETTHESQPKKVTKPKVNSRKTACKEKKTKPPTPKKRELKSNRKSLKIGKARTNQTLVKELLRDFRNYFRDGFLQEQEGKHNHVLTKTKVQRVKQRFLEKFLVPEETFESYKYIFVELMLPNRKDLLLEMQAHPEQMEMIRLMRKVFYNAPNNKDVKRILENNAIKCLFGNTTDISSVKVFK